MQMLTPSIAMAQNGNPYLVNPVQATANPDHSISASFKIAVLPSGSTTLTFCIYRQNSSSSMLMFVPEAAMAKKSTASGVHANGQPSQFH